MDNSEVSRKRKHFFLLHDFKTNDVFYESQENFSLLGKKTESESEEQPAGEAPTYATR